MFWIVLILLVIITHQTVAAEMPQQLHHHMHSFSGYYLGGNSIATKHAEELGYTLATYDKRKDITALEGIKLSNAYFLPLQLDLRTNSIQFLHWMGDDRNISLLRKDRPTEKNFTIDKYDLNMLSVFGCQRAKLDELTTGMQQSDWKRIFFMGWEAGEKLSIVTNYQSKFVVQNLVKKTVQSFKGGNYRALFLDDLARDVPGCANKDAGNEGSYPSWKDGQKDFIVSVQRHINEISDNRGYIFTNLWHPLDPVNEKILQWYADGSLRLEHYYLEAGPQKDRSIKANGVEPRSDKPAYVGHKGYLPADKLSISTSYGWYGERISDDQKRGYKTGRQNYVLQHYAVAGLAATQGSWFGWYGESGPDRRELSSEHKAGAFVHTNDLQLLRAIPGWDNLKSVPLKSRSYDSGKRQYSSPNSFFSPQVIYSRHYATGEMFAVFKSGWGHIELRPGETVASAWFANHYFGKTDESALSCLEQSGNTVILRCDHALDRSIRISLTFNENGKRP